MKMYIVIFDDVPVGLVPVISAHGSLMCYLKYKETEEIKEWLNSFKKVVVSAKRDMLNDLLTLPDVIKITESTLDNLIVGLVYLPKVENPIILKKLPLWKN